MDRNIKLTFLIFVTIIILTKFWCYVDFCNYVCQDETFEYQINW